MSTIVAREEAHGAVAVPHLEGIGLVLALPVRPLDLQDYVARGNHSGDVVAGEWLLELEVPLRCALPDEPRELLFPSSPV